MGLERLDMICERSHELIHDTQDHGLHAPSECEIVAARKVTNVLI